MSARVRKAARLPDRPVPEIDRFRAQHLSLAQREVVTEFGAAAVVVDEAESPLAWLARRRGSNGRALIEAHQLQAGERLRADFTCANLMPRTTSNWASPIAADRRGGDRAASTSDVMIAARQRLHLALDAAGPEFSGLLVDVCCFLKGLVDVERDRAWPQRTAKIVLQLGLERLARHYGYAGEARGRARAQVRTWLADDVAFGVE